MIHCRRIELFPNYENVFFVRQSLKLVKNAQTQHKRSKFGLGGSFKKSSFNCNFERKINE